MNTNDGKNHLHDVVNDFDVAMLVTHTANAIHARPMAIARMDDGIGAYLVTDINSLKIDEISVNPHAVLTFQSARKFASVRGELTVLRDRKLIEKMWKEAWKVWLPWVVKAKYWPNPGMRSAIRTRWRWPPSSELNKAKPTTANANGSLSHPTAGSRTSWGSDNSA